MAIYDHLKLPKMFHLWNAFLCTVSRLAAHVLQPLIKLRKILPFSLLPKYFSKYQGFLVSFGEIFLNFYQDEVNMLQYHSKTRQNNIQSYLNDFRL